MDGFTREAFAERAAVQVGYVDRLVDLGILPKLDAGSLFSVGDVRRARLIHGLEEGGLPLEGIGTAVRDGDLSFGFLDLPSWDWYGGFARTTYRELSAETGVAVELLQAIRESMGSARPEPGDPVHEELLDLIPVVKVVLDAGISHVDRAIISMYHGQSEHTWLANVIEAVEATLEKTGLHHTEDAPPAMCFLDLSGYSRLTEERGDEAAAGMAATLGRLVQRSASDFGGRPIKWLVDRVMLYFTEPGQAVVSALELADTVPAAGLPPAHTGIDAGPVIFQDGDYFGRTVNTAARIAAHAGPGEVLVSDSVVRSPQNPAIRFVGVGPVALKGLPQPIELHRAVREA